MSMETPQFDPAVEASCTAAERQLRQRTLKEGILTYGDGAMSTKCTVRDLSAGGAKLRILNDIPWPNRFRIHVPSDGLSADCEVRWREGMTMGVAFIGDLKLSERTRPQVTAPIATNSSLRRKF